MCVEKLTRFALQKRDEVKHRPKLFIFHPLVGRQRSIVRSFGQLVKTNLDRWSRTQLSNFRGCFGRKTLHKWIKRSFENLGCAHKKKMKPSKFEHEARYERSGITPI